MGKYRGPKVKLVRRLGLLPGLTRKDSKNRKKTPGEHGKIISLRGKRSIRLSLSDDYREGLLEKQKLRFNYGVSENQLVTYYQQANRSVRSTGEMLLEYLENRLDCIVYRLGFAPTIPAARQMINHRHILVNQKTVNIPSFQCKTNDSISFNQNVPSTKFIQFYFETQQQKRKLIQRRMQRVRLKRSRFHSLLPNHLEIQNEKDIIGKLIGSVTKKDVLVRVNELKVVEFYSR
jgi:small subunit ribosomal protein S4